MNGLSLRVSSIRTNENVKRNSEIRMDLFNVPSSYFYQRRENKFISGLTDASSVDEQIKILKEYAEYISNMEKGLLSNIEILADLFIEAPLKHAVRNTISKFLSQVTIGKEIVLLGLSNTIRNRIQSYDIPQKHTLASRNAIIASIGSCFDNFKVGIEAIRCCLQEILSFLNKSLVLYIEQMSRNISPADKSEISVFIHTTLRVVISCFNQYPGKLNDSYEGEKNVEKVILICWDLLNNPEVPMDTKINCGILITLSANIEKRYLRLTERIFSEENSAKKLCLLNGVICTMETDFFNGPDFMGFKIFTKVANVLKEISEENSIEPSIVLGVARGFSQMTKKLLSIQIKEYLDRDHRELVEILAVNLGYSLSHLDHYMDSVRYLCKELLRLTIQLGVKINDRLNHIIYDYIRNVNININTKCILISAICSIVKAKAVLGAVPNVIEFLLRSLAVNDQANVNLHINNCYETLMMSYGYNENKQEWFNKWINPILMEIMKNGNNAGIKQALFDLIRKAIKTYPEIAICMIDSKVTVNFGIILTSLGIAKKSGLFDKIDSNPLKWKNLLSYREIKLAMISGDDSTRMAALYLLTECHKSTELFTKEDLECLLFFLETNINVQAPSLRQKITCYMKNAMNRLKSGFLSIIKKSDTDGKSHYYYDFVKKLHHFCIDNLFVGANYSRRTISFQILIQLLQIASYIFYDNENSNMWNERHVGILLNSLNDSYEANKVYCMNILMYCPKMYFDNYNYLINYDIVKELMTSCKPNDALSAAYYLEYLCFINTAIEAPVVVEESVSVVHSRVHKTLLWCEHTLQHGLHIAKTSLSRAARENPMFGSLACIRHLLNKLDFKEIAKCNRWVQFVWKLLHTCRELSSVVAVVVNNSSPEGSLPNDFSMMENCIYDEDVEMESFEATIDVDIASDVEAVRTTPQMVLLCAWRTIKEVSLILGDIAFKSPVIRTQLSIVNTQDDYVGLISCDQVVQIGTHFTDLLSETKHRGAFEQAYIGFCKLCIRLWGSQHEELHKLPMKWLQEMISAINSNCESVIKSEKICPTRRSAGIPYMMQALITSELQVSSSKGFQFSMKNLLELCRTGSTSQTRTHALNILRALFRTTDLGDSIGEFVADGFECAINGYDAESWSERNSSTLLYSALMIRVFGVQRTKDSENLNIRNKMTGRIFFLRYPQLYDFFVTELEKASQLIVSGGRSKKLHPLLLLLSRLYPSALEGSESNLKLSRFVPIVSICSGCAELQTRHLAAQFIAIIVSPDLIFDRIFLLLESLNRSNNKKINPNSLHGALLQILYLVKTRTLGVMPESSNQLNNWIELYTAISNYLFEVKSNFILYGAIIDILIEILARCQNVIFTEDDQFLDDLSNIVDYLFNLTKQKAYYGIDSIMRRIVLIKLVMFMYNDDENVSSECFLCDIDSTKYTYDYIESLMNIILLVLDFNENSSNADQLELDKMELFYIRHLNDCKRTKIKAIRSEFIKSQKCHSHLKTIIERNIYHSCVVKAYTILSYSITGIQILLTNNDNVENLKTMFEMTTCNSDQLKSSIYKCIQCIYYVELKNDSLGINLLPRMSSATQCSSIRATTIRIVRIISRRFPEYKTFELYMNFSRTLIALLNDDDSDIREEAAELVTNLFSYTQKTKIHIVTVIPSYAQKVFLQTLTKVMLTRKFTIKHVIAMILILMAYETENDEQIPDRSEKSESRVFDRNELNVYGESLLFKEYCIREIQNLIALHNTHIDDCAEHIIKIAETHCDFKFAFHLCLAEVKKSVSLIDISNDKHLL
ncbi:thyroid adenoma-associated protein homolog [Toxorhynchites rutilus septentrionalis]|uniref:thyroid adenoma-associated protein homolog n=1 Tax=Toxorhynchites rutilus septentrionalis TaxID=329112 RepID=UPI00247A3620|nr:thyroid adenoma-associated protein homolog [Toxorhynchites rutilus septentrionalis]